MLVWSGVLVVLLVLAATAVRVGVRASDLQAQVANLMQAGRGGAVADLPRVRTAVKSIRVDLQEIRGDLAWAFPLLSRLGWVPVVGGDLSQADHLFRLASDLSAAADESLVAIGNALDGDPAVPVLERAAASLHDDRERLALARAHLARAEAAREQLDASSLSSGFAPLLKQVDRGLPLARLAVDGALVAPDLLGAKRAQTYLIVAQNEDELRATGGFVSAVVRVTLERGQLTELSYLDSYQVDDLEKVYPPPPDALERTMRAGMLLFRDANWSPDFPATARLLARLYAAGQGVEVDGIVALDQEALRLLVRSVAPLDVPGTPPRTVDADNLIAYMRDSWAPPSGVATDAAWLARKGFVGNLAQAFQRRLTGAGPVDESELLRGIYEALQARRISVWFRSAALHDALGRTGWDGAVRPGDGDFLMVVDSNVGFNKANALVSQAFQLETTLSPDLSVHSTLSITYRHAGTPSTAACVQRVPDYGPAFSYATLMDTCYWDYLRILVPKGTALRNLSRQSIPGAQLLGKQDSSGEPEVLNEDVDTDAFATFFYVGKGAARTVGVSFAPPPGAVTVLPDGALRYRLRWRKQAGTPAVPVAVQVTLPPGARLESASATPAAKVTRLALGGATSVAAELQLATDALLDVTFRPR